MPADPTAPPPTEEELAALGAAMGTGRLAHDHRLTGGLGCTMDVLRAGDRLIVLRRYGPWHGPDTPVAAQEVAALGAAAAGGVRVPEPLWIDDEGIFERRAIVTSFVGGSPNLAPADPVGWADELARTLAAIHRVDPPTILGRVEAGEVEAEHAAPPSRIADHDLGGAVWAARLRELAGLEPASSVLLHADFWPGNTLWEDGRISAVVDWEQPLVGDPMLDVAYCMTDIAYLGLDVGRRFLTTYVEATGHSTASLRYWRLASLCRPMPDIGQWFPDWDLSGAPNATEARARHRAEILDLLSG